MREFARTVLMLAAVALGLCAVIAALWAVMAFAERRPDIPVWVWLASAIGSLAAAGFCAWCVAMLETADRVDALHQMIEKDLHERSKRQV